MSIVAKWNSWMDQDDGGKLGPGDVVLDGVPVPL